jgi:hypothetical protein
MNTNEIGAAVEEALRNTPFIDIHTHLFPPSFGNFALWGIDELLTYHYLEAELFRVSETRPEQYWKLTKGRRADLVWKNLFVDRTPISEAARGVIAVLQAFGLDTTAASLTEFREFFRAQNPADHFREIFHLSGVSQIVMTNDPLDPNERALWSSGAAIEPSFRAALRLDRILNEGALETVPEVRRCLDLAVQRTNPLYMAVSLPDEFVFPADDIRTHLLREAILPACRDLRLPLALMIGVRRRVNPALRDAGDAVGRANLGSLEALCTEFPDNRFLVTVLSRENQHELCVYARKFSNILPFGCWWFLNNPSIVEEITRERLEMLGTSFIPQHSDARVLEQLIYKWRNTRRTMAPILTRSYQLLAEDGRTVTSEEIRRDIRRLFRGNFESWTRSNTQ